MVAQEAAGTVSREGVYYWKCDRPAAFHVAGPRAAVQESMHGALRAELCRHFQTGSVELAVANSQGNHLTWTAEICGLPLFIRVEDGPEGDAHLEVESAVMRQVAEAGVRVPEVHAVDASRSRVPFAWQAIERVPFGDLNQEAKAGRLNVPSVAREIGVAVARWQQIQPEGFGVLNVARCRRDAGLEGFHRSYDAYFLLNLERHLAFLQNNGFLSISEVQRVWDAVSRHGELLRLPGACLVHKDLALWNVLGTGHSVEAFIDFDDAVAGDPTDDLSLLGCFHHGDFVSIALDGYRSVRAEPDCFLPRFWLHLLRNMIVKAVIRVGAGYFEKSSDFYLIGPGGSGTDLRAFTRSRIDLAVEALVCGAPLSNL
jgi:aminoglycoside phosphotransferase